MNVNRIAELDALASSWCHRPSQRRIWFLVSRLGDGWLYAAAYFGLRNHGRVSESQHVAACVFIAWSACSLLKMLFRRKRQNPVWAQSRILAKRGKLRMLSTLSSWSFPSQHAACSVAFAAAFPHPLSVVLAAGVCASRVLIGAHYLGDMVAGVAVGLLAGMLA